MIWVIGNVEGNSYKEPFSKGILARSLRVSSIGLNQAYEIANDIENNLIERGISEISVDEYPFGIALEIESKSETKDPEENIKYWVNKLGLNLEDSYRLSWDDKYKELCKAQNIPSYSEVTFDKEMPKVVKK